MFGGFKLVVFIKLVIRGSNVIGLETNMVSSFYT